MKNKKSNEKGELSITFIVGLVIILIGAGILFLFFNQLNLSGSVDSEACHQSVIFRGTVPSLAENYVPLKCKTEKVCVTSKLLGGKCADFGDLKGITKVQVSKIEDVEKTLSEKAINCYSMMGEGKVGLFSQYFAEKYALGSVYPTCVICNRVAFDSDSLKKSGIDLSQMDLQKYMQTHAVSGKEISYFDYISQGAAKINIGDDIAFPQVNEIKDPKTGNISYTVDPSQPNSPLNLLSEQEVKALIENERNNYKLQNSELAVLFMQISAPKYDESLFNLGKTALGIGGGSVAIVGAGNTVKGLSFIGKSCTKFPLVCGALAAVAGIFQVGSVANNRAISASVCGDVSIGDQARDGCSTIRIVNYDQESIKQYCGVIESIP